MVHSFDSSFFLSALLLSCRSLVICPAFCLPVLPHTYLPQVRFMLLSLSTHLWAEYAPRFSLSYATTRNVDIVQARGNLFLID